MMSNDVNDQMETKYYKVKVCWEDFGSEDDSILCEEQDLYDVKEMVYDDFIEICDDHGWKYEYSSCFPSEKEDDDEPPIDLRQIERDISALEISEDKFIELSKTVRQFDRKTKTADIKD